MSLRRTVGIVLATAVAVCLVGLSGVPALGAPLADQVAQDRAALERALARHSEAQAYYAAIEARVLEASTKLDLAIAEEQRCQERLRARAVAMYRSEGSSPLTLILGASSIQELTARLDVLDRIARQDALNIAALKAAQAEARDSAEDLLAVQAEAAEALEAIAGEVAAARAELAASEAALREYEARLAAEEAARKAAAAAREAAAREANQQLVGSGEWQTGVASHYSINFTGRGANGEPIGPYTMMCAHKTLPFGTLVEFEYKGRRAVAKVADRGPYVPGRMWDLGPGVTRVLGFNGVHEVRYRIVSR